MRRLAQLIYLLAPAYIANMAPPFVRFWKGWNRAISRRWLGAHKTVVGAAIGVAAGVATAALQARVAWRGSIVDYDHWFAIGILLGVGAMGGDIVKSLIKRRRGIPPGARWMPIDQLDFIAGALMLIQPEARLSWVDVILVFGVTFAGDVVVNQVAFRLRIRTSPW